MVSTCALIVQSPSRSVKRLELTGVLAGSLMAVTLAKLSPSTTSFPVSSSLVRITPREVTLPGMVVNIISRPLALLISAISLAVNALPIEVMSVRLL